MITERPANGFDTKVYVKHAHWNFSRPAWARYSTATPTHVEVIYIRKDGDFGGLIVTEPRSRVICPA